MQSLKAKGVESDVISQASISTGGLSHPCILKGSCMRHTHGDHSPRVGYHIYDRLTKNNVLDLLRYALQGQAVGTCTCGWLYGRDAMISIIISTCKGVHHPLK